MAIGDSTRRTYSSGVRSYIDFMSQNYLTPAFPATVEDLCLWVSDLASRVSPCTIGTIRVYLAAVFTRHAELGYHHPLRDAPPLLDRILLGIKRVAEHPHKKPKLPITTRLLQAMSSHTVLGSAGDCLLWAMMWLALTGLLRISEFTVKGVDDVDRVLRISQLWFITRNNGKVEASATSLSLASVHYAVLHLDASKTDPFRIGTDIIIASQSALHALAAYLSVRPHGTRGVHAPLFTLNGTLPITRGWFMTRVCILLRRIDLDPTLYSSHSFRKGGAVSLQERGVADSVLRKVGRWKSDAFHSYVKDASLETLVTASQLL
jgi:hypothetical protein